MFSEFDPDVWCGLWGNLANSATVVPMNSCVIAKYMGSVEMWASASPSPLHFGRCAFFAGLGSALTLPV